MSSDLSLERRWRDRISNYHGPYRTNGDKEIQPQFKSVDDLVNYIIENKEKLYIISGEASSIIKLQEVDSHKIEYRSLRKSLILQQGNSYSYINLNNSQDDKMYKLFLQAKEEQNQESEQKSLRTFTNYFFIHPENKS